MAERLSGVDLGGPAYGLTRDAAGRVTRIDRPDSRTTTYAYDLRGGVTQIKQSPATGNPLDQLDYVRDDVGRVTEITHAGGDVLGYTYNPLSRLVREDRTGSLSYDQSFTYDSAGNRTLRIRGAAVTIYTYDNANRMSDETTGGTTTTYDHDDDGNRTRRTTGADVRQYTYDAESRLTGTTTAAQTAVYTYDAFARRVTATVDGVTTNYLHDGRHPLAAFGPAGPLESWAYAEELLVRSTQPGGTFEVFQDAVRSVSGLLASGGGLSTQYAYGGFGAVESTVGGPATALRFAAQLVDPALDEPVFARGVLDTAAGRFLSVPIADSLYRRNDYPYAANDPIRIFIDTAGTLLLHDDDVAIPFPSPTGSSRSPDEAGWWSGQDTSGSNTIGCDGSGNLEVYESTNYPHGVQECTRAHEQGHIRDWYSRYGRNICKDRAKGDLPHYNPPGKGAYADFLKKSECRSWKIGQSCRQQKFKACCDLPTEAEQNACKSSVRPHVKFAKKMVKKYCN